MKRNRIMILFLAGSLILGNSSMYLYAGETEEQLFMIEEDNEPDILEEDIEGLVEEESVLRACGLIEEDDQLYSAASYWVNFDYMNSQFEVLSGESATVKATGSREGEVSIQIVDIMTPEGEKIPSSERDSLLRAETTGNSLTIFTNYVSDIPDFNVYVRATLTVDGIEVATTYDPRTGGDAYIKVRNGVMGIEFEEYPQTDVLSLVAGREYTLTPALIRSNEGFSTPPDYLFQVTSNDPGALEVSTQGTAYGYSYLLINGERREADIPLYRGGTGFTVKKTSNIIPCGAETELTLTVNAYKYSLEEDAWELDTSRDYHFAELYGDLFFGVSIDVTKDSRDSTFIDAAMFNRFKEALGDEYVNISYSFSTGEYVNDIFIPDPAIDISGMFSYDPSTGELQATGTFEQLKSVANDNDGFHIMVTGYLYGQEIMKSNGYVWVDGTSDIENPPINDPPVNNPPVNDPSNIPQWGAHIQATAETITISKKPSIKKPAAAKGKITVKWKHFKHTSKKTKKIWKKIKKVQIQCATDKAFKNIVKTATVKKSKTSAKIKGLKKKTIYYVRVRYFDGTGYSAWSKVKKVKTK